jgi:hypothetical protein
VICRLDSVTRAELLVGDERKLLPLFLPEPELQRRIMVENPARLFKFDT